MKQRSYAVPPSIASAFAAVLIFMPVQSHKKGREECKQTIEDQKKYLGRDHVFLDAYVIMERRSAPSPSKAEKKAILKDNPGIEREFILSQEKADNCDMPDIAVMGIELRRQDVLAVHSKNLARNAVKAGLF